MLKAKYVLSPGAEGDIHTSPLLKKAGAKTCFELGKPDSLDQEDLEHLYENKHTNLILKVEPIIEAKAEKKPTKKED